MMRRYLFTSIVLVGFFIFPALSSGGIFDFFDSKPELTEKQKKWVWHNHNPALGFGFGSWRVLEDGYKMIRAYRQEERKTKTRTIPAVDYVDWGFKVVVRNNSTDTHQLKVSYTLVDEDGFEVETTYAKLGYDFYGKYVSSGETVTIQESGNMTYDVMTRVKGRTLSVGCSVNCLLKH